MYFFKTNSLIFAFLLVHEHDLSFLFIPEISSRHVITNECTFTHKVSTLHCVKREIHSWIIKGIAWSHTRDSNYLRNIIMIISKSSQSQKCMYIYTCINPQFDFSERNIFAHFILWVRSTWDTFWAVQYIQQQISYTYYQVNIHICCLLSKKQCYT